MTGAELIIPILIGVSCTLNIAIITGGRVTDFRRWLVRNWYHITYIDRISCNGSITNNFIVISYFINLILSNIKSDGFKKYTININNEDLNAIPTGDCIEIKMKIDGNRKKELNLRKCEIVFWVIATGNRGSSPNGYELWVNYPEQVSDVYRLFTLFFRFHTNCPLSFMNFTTIFRISNDNVRNTTYNEVILNTKQNIKFSLTKCILSLKSYNYRQIANEKNKFESLNTYFDELKFATNKEDMYLGLCLQNKKLFFDETLTQSDLRKFINDTRKQFSHNELAYVIISSLACIYNFKSFLEMKFNELNINNRIEKSKKISSLVDIQSSLKNYTLKSFFSNILKQYNNFPIINQILLILYLEYNKSQNILNMDMDDIINEMFNKSTISEEEQNYTIYEMLEQNNTYEMLEQDIELTQIPQNVINNLVDEDDEDDENYSETVLLLKKEN